MGLFCLSLYICLISIFYVAVFYARTHYRWCGLPVSGSSPVMKLTSSGNVMLVTFSFSRQRDGAIFKAYFQAIPKAGKRTLITRPNHISYYLISTNRVTCITCRTKYSNLCTYLCHHFPVQLVVGQFPLGTAPFPHPTTLPITLLI